jgi:endoglucanase
MNKLWIIGLAALYVGLSACNQSPTPSVATSSTGTLNTEAVATDAQVRLNQVGYAPGASKVAVLLSSQALSSKAFRVLNATGSSVFSGVTGKDRGAWNTHYTHTYPLEFSGLRTVGRYSIAVDGAQNSVKFLVDTAAHLYAPLLKNAWFFFEAQKDGPNINHNVMGRQPSHLADSDATVYQDVTYDADGVLTSTQLKPLRAHLNVSGGWADAGDYLKFTQTTSYTVAALLFAQREYPSTLAQPGSNLAETGRWGLEWLKKMWDDQTRTLYLQVGIGDGNGSSILGDHDFWRLPQADDALQAKATDPNYFVKFRPVFRANEPGKPISPNLAGRVAASFALCAQLWKDRTCLSNAEHIFALANTTPGQLKTALPFDYYGETQWRDDLELAAIELAKAETLLGGNASPYIAAAKRWATAYIASPDHGKLGVYDVAALAHFDLLQTLRTSGMGSDPVVKLVLDNLKKDLGVVKTQAAKDPFGFGTPYGQFDAAANAIGMAVTANLVDRLEGQSAGWRELGTLERDWLLGRNAWGVSLVIGAGTNFTRCPQHQVANLSKQTLLGAVVNGPNNPAQLAGVNLTDFSFASKCATLPDPYQAFNSSSSAFVDNVNAWPMAEPAIDYTVGSVILFAQEANAADR